MARPLNDLGHREVGPVRVLSVKEGSRDPDLVGDLQLLSSTGLGCRCLFHRFNVILNVPNVKLRFDAADGVWRVAFAFDPQRRAVLLAAGYESGGSEKRFYAHLIRKADERSDDHVSRLKQKRGVSHGNDVETEDECLEDRAAEVIAEELSLRDLRRAHRLTQERVGEFLGIGPEGVCRLGERSDLLISTLRSYVKAMGGHENRCPDPVVPQK